MNDVLTAEELATKLNKPVSWVRRLVTFSPHIKPLVVWQNYDPDTDFFRVCALMTEIGESFEQPFIDHDRDIIVRMGDSFAFIFDLEGKRK